MSQSDLAIRVRGLSKSYTIRHQQQAAESTLAETMLKRLRKPFGGSSTSETFWALQDVDFDVKKGDVVGVIGRNGAGKSTLLKILSRITEPTRGRIELYGRIGSLLEVGTGFHPELTGRENIFLNGNILGMSRAEIRKQFDAIVDFAGVEKFLDTPVKRYSSGMYVRLAFAVAAHLESEILIVDEVLAVGDLAFQEKCLAKIRGLSQCGRTVLLVSHNTSTVTTLCSKGILLRKGGIEASSEVHEVIRRYLSIGTSESQELTWSPAEAEGQDGFKLLGLSLRSADGRAAGGLTSQQGFSVRAHVQISRPMTGLRFGLLLRRIDGTVVAGANDPTVVTGREIEPGEYSMSSTLVDPLLNDGVYQVAVGFDEYPYRSLLCLTDYVLTFEVEDIEGRGVKRERMPGLVHLPLHWSASRIAPTS